jgi:hypothetical protein
MTYFVAPAQGHPAKYYFAETPQAGAAAWQRETLSSSTAPASAGVTDILA